MKKKNIQKKRRANAKFTKFVATLILVMAAVCTILIVNKNQVHAVQAGSSDPLNKYYKTITIQPGDTLWSIAQEYKSDDVTTKKYIKELMSMNNLHNDNITSGMKLIVTYFE